jgi:hypothetical protein
MRDFGVSDEKIKAFGDLGSSPLFALCSLAKHKVGSSTLLTRSRLKPLGDQGLFSWFFPYPMPRESVGNHDPYHRCG